MNATQDPLESVDLAEVVLVCACSNFRKTSRAVTQMFDEILAPTGLRATQIVLLVAIGAEETTTAPRLGQRLALDASTLARGLKRLEHDSLIERTSSSRGRRITISLTEKGREALREAIPYWKRAQHNLVSRLGEDTWSDLKATLAEVVEAAKV